MIEIKRIYRRYWFPHPRYIEAWCNRYACFKPWRPYVDVIIGYRYSVNGREVRFP